MKISSIVSNDDFYLMQERRQRNKKASQKYREKKNNQMEEMKVMITNLTEKNQLLEKQVNDYQLENQRLKSTIDKLRGKFVAKKLLKKWIEQYQDNDKIMDLFNDFILSDDE